MKQLLILLTVTTLTANAQKDTGKIHDTIPIVIYHNMTDTMETPLFFRSIFGLAKIIKGYTLVTGDKVIRDKQLVWLAQPVITGYLNKKKHPIKRKPI